MKKCPICNVVALLAGLGAVNWALTAFANLNLVTRFLGDGTTAAKAVYGVIGAAGVLLLVALVKPCPCGSKK